MKAINGSETRLSWHRCWSRRWRGGRRGAGTPPLLASVLVTAVEAWGIGCRNRQIHGGRHVPTAYPGQPVAKPSQAAAGRGAGRSCLSEREWHGPSHAVRLVFTADTRGDPWPEPPACTCSGPLSGVRFIAFRCGPERHPVRDGVPLAEIVVR